MVQNHLHMLLVINKYLRTMIFRDNIQERPSQRVTSTCMSKIVYIMVLIDFKYKIAMAGHSYQ